MFERIIEKFTADRAITIEKICFKRGRNELSIELTISELYDPALEAALIADIRAELPFVKSIQLAPVFKGQFDDAAAAVAWLMARACAAANGAVVEAFDIELSGAEIRCVADSFGAYHHVNNVISGQQLADQLAAIFDMHFAVNLVEPTARPVDDAVLESMMDALFEAKPNRQSPAAKSAPKIGDDDIVYKKRITSPIVKLSDMAAEGELIAISGEVLRSKSINTKTGKIIFTFILSDYSDAIKCKLFLKKKEADAMAELVKEKARLIVLGYKRFDSYDKESVLNVQAINLAPAVEKRQDRAPEKRIEFNLHTNMSAMDGIADVEDYISTALSWGHKALAITDNGVVQAYPAAMARTKKEDFKIIYGVEGYMIDDEMEIVENIKDYQLNDSFVVFDLETTGFSPRYDGITEIGAIKVKNGAIVDRYSQLVNPEKKIPQKVVELTGINDDMVANKPKIKEVIGDFLDFCGDCPVVAHNAAFDVSFIREKAKSIEVDYRPTVLDTLMLARLLLKDIKRFGLKVVAKHLGVPLDNHHRAVDDALATAKVFNILVEKLASKGIHNLAELADYGQSALSFKHFDVYNISILATDQTGLKELYQLISHSHMTTFYKKPLIPKKLLAEKRAHLLLGSAGVEGELYQALLANKPELTLRRIAQFYDYLEVQPIENHRYLIERGLMRDDAELKKYNLTIIDLAAALDKLCIATGDAHFIEPSDALYRDILLSGQGGRVDNKTAPLYFRTTDEMLESFDYLDEALARQIVIYNTWQLNEKIGDVLPIPKETFPPIIEGSDVELRTMCYAKARALYGDPLPEIVERRLTRELDSIITHGYAVMYIIAQKLVSKSMADGYLVGSRGSVGSSFAATMAGITEVNPLPAHYYCSSCQFVDFAVAEQYKIGADLPDRRCPHCQTALVKDGFDIPFETFLGFEGDKEPDIDLNFASVYQSTSHAYTEQLFGEGYTYKAGTIGTVADKTAFGFVKKYCEENDIFVSNYEVERMASGCVGVKRTTGQHPGGIMVVPNYKDIHDFSPIQYPANDKTSGVVTTHFDYHSLSGKILKLDNLGHDVPTIARMLSDKTGIDVMKIPLDDAATLAIFTSLEPLKILDDDYFIDSATLGIPEFGTKFVRGMLKETQPTTIEELVQISGLSHGADVWLGNAQQLIEDKICTLKEVIGTRDNIMLYLIDKGLPKKEAFTITEKVRKGKGLSDQQMAMMREYDVPDWYIESCLKISYMFPKAHAAAYVMMAVRIAYFKVHQPLAYYATYFTVKVDDFDAQLICQGKQAVRDQLASWSNQEKLSNKEETQYTVMESALEMYARGFQFKPVDLYRSAASDFIIEDGAILPPLRALQGIGKNAAESIVAARSAGEFISIKDIKLRSSANRSVIEALRYHGALAGLPEDNQLSLDFFLN